MLITTNLSLYLSVKTFKNWKYTHLYLQMLNWKKEPMTLNPNRSEQASFCSTVLNKRSTGAFSSSSNGYWETLCSSQTCTRLNSPRSLVCLWLCLSQAWVLCEVERKVFRSQPRPLNTTLTVPQGSGPDRNEARRLRELMEEKPRWGEVRKRQTKGN